MPQGIRHTLNITQDTRVVDMSDEILLLDSGRVPLLFLASHPYTSGEADDRSKPPVGFKKREVYNPEFSWLDDQLISKETAVNNAAGIAAGDNTIEVDDASLFRTGSIVHVPRTDAAAGFPYGELMKVTAVDTTTNVITVVRNYVNDGPGVGTGMALVDNEPLWILHSVSEEGASSPEAVHTLKQKRYNYTTIARTYYDVTNTEAASKLYGGPDLAYQRRKMGIEHAEYMERTILFSGLRETTGPTGNPERTFRGLIRSIQTNIFDVSGMPGGSLTEDNLETIARAVFRYGNNTKYFICSPLICSRIAQLATNKLQTQIGQNVYGIKITEYITTVGILRIIPDFQFTGPVYGGAGVIVDPEYIRYCYLNNNGINRDTKLYLNRQNNNEDRIAEEYLTEFSLEVRLEQTHAYVYGVS